MSRKGKEGGVAHELKLPARAFQFIKVAVENRVMTVQLSRPEERNAFTESMRAEIVQAFSDASRDARVRAVVLTGDPAGNAFCAGASLGGGQFGGTDAASALMDVPAGRRADASTWRDGGGVAALSILRCTKPVIAAINGAAVGVGMTLPCACDMRVAEAGSKVGFVFTRRGLACESVSSWLLPRIIGMGKAMELVLTGRVFDPRDAPDGLFNYVVPKGQALAKAYELAREIADNTSGMSVALSRLSLLRNANMTPEQAHLTESKIIHFLIGSADNKEGVTSFLEKRPPNFTLEPWRDLPDFLPWWSQADTESKL